MIRAVLDTTILISGILFGGISLKILEAGLKKKFTIVTSPILIDEAERVLSSKKFGLSSSEIKNAISPIWNISEIVVPKIKINHIKSCPADDRVLEAAVEGYAQFIVTGDRRDLLSLVTYKNIRIVTGRMFIENFT